jgi:oleandomycin transport system permease protein
MTAQIAEPIAAGAAGGTAAGGGATGGAAGGAGAGQPGRALRRRIGARQTLVNGLTLAWRNVTQLKHSPEKLMDVTLMPIIFLLLFLYVFGGVVAGSTHAYLEQLLPGLVGQMAMFATMGLGTALCEDIHKGVFDRFRSLPIARSSPLIGAVLGDTVRFSVVMAVLTGFGSALGFRFHTGLLSILAAYALAYVFYLAVCWVSVLIGLIAPSPQTVQGIAFIWTMPLVFGSSVLLANTATMPGWLQAWVKVNPVTHLADAVRALTIGGPVGSHAYITLAWAAGIVLVAFPLAMRMYRRRM